MRGPNTQRPAAASCAVDRDGEGRKLFAFDASHHKFLDITVRLDARAWWNPGTFIPLTKKQKENRGSWAARSRMVRSADLCTIDPLDSPPPLRFISPHGVCVVRLIIQTSGACAQLCQTPHFGVCLHAPVQFRFFFFFFF